MGATSNISTFTVHLLLVRSVDVKSTPKVSFISPEPIRGFSVHMESMTVTVVMISEEGSLYICHWITSDRLAVSVMYTFTLIRLVFLYI